MICPNCGGEFTGLRCPYCGTENEEAALGHQQKEVRSRYEAIARMLHMPLARARALVRWVSIGAAALVVLFLLGLAGAAIYSRLAPEIAFQRQEAILKDLETLLRQQDYAGLENRLDRMDDSYKAVYDKYNAIRDIHREIAYVEENIEEDIELSLAVEGHDLFSWDIYSLCTALHLCRELEEAGWVYDEEQHVLPLRQRAEDILKTRLLLTEEEIAQGIALIGSEDPDFAPLAKTALERLGGKP